MDRDRKICIWYQKATGKYPNKEASYCWSCPCRPGSKGKHRFNRFTDYARAARIARGGSTHQSQHPYDRCWRAVELHLWRYHRDEQATSHARDTAGQSVPRVGVS